jgi:hypothetical protein
VPEVAETPLYSGDMTKNLPPPNHLLPLEIPPAGKELAPRYRWPLVMAERKASQDEIDSELPPLIQLFTSTLHGEYVAGQHDHPPTWMDPHVLVALAEQQPEIQALLEKIWATNDASLVKKLEPLLDDVFERLYLAYVRYEFEKHARPVIAQWLASSFAAGRITAQLAERDRKTSRRQKVK